MAELSLSYGGSVQYELLKTYPNREVMLLTETMNTINDRKNAAMGAKSKTFGMDGPAPADMDVPIGDFTTRNE